MSHPILTSHPTAKRLIVWAVVILAVLSVAPVSDLGGPTPAVAVEPSRYFPATGHAVRGVFLRFFDHYGGVRIFGYPVSDVITEDGLPVQYFERARFEYHRELAGTPYEVQLSNLGAMLGRDKVAFTPIQPFTSKPDRVYFRETGHSLGGAFLNFWKVNGGVRIFGYPVSEPVTLRDGAVVQYFERARMEYYAGRAGRAERGVQLGLLGNEYLQANPGIAEAIARSARDGVSRGGVRPSAAQTQSVQAPASAPASPAGGAAATGLNEREQALLDYINSARRSANISPVGVEPALTTIARARSGDMAVRGYFSHITPEGTTYMDLLKAAGILFKYSGEVIAYNSYPADQAAYAAYDTFMKSPAHRSILLDGRYSLVGLGEARDSRGFFYYTVIFIQR